MQVISRKWEDFIPNCRSNLGFLTIVAIGIGLMAVSQIPILPDFIIYFGIVAVLLGLFLFFKASWPESKTLAKDVLGDIVSLNALDNIYPKLVKVGIIGESSVGKTTLSENITQLDYSKARTQTTYARISVTRIKPTKYFALIDGPGNNTHQQFEIIKNSEIIVVILDHNNSDTDTKISRERLRDLSNLNNQFRNLLEDIDLKPKQIHVLLNKKDLWENGESEDELNLLKDWFKNEIDNWTNFDRKILITHGFHSNRVNPDLNMLIKQIKLL